MGLNTQQQIQEEEYFSPYHWHLKKNTKKGVVYFGYWNLALSVAGGLEGKAVLDAGCGDGFFTSLILKKNPKSVSGVDYSVQAISFAKEKCEGAEFKAEDLSATSFRENLFDVVFLIEVFEHIPNNKKKEIVDELYRILKPGGRLIVSVPSINLPVVDKHEEHFTKGSLEKSFCAPFVLVKIVGQDRGGLLGNIYQKTFRLWKNKFWHIQFFTNFWTGILYPIFLNKSPVKSANRLIAVFEK